MKTALDFVLKSLWGVRGEPLPPKMLTLGDLGRPWEHLWEVLGDLWNTLGDLWEIFGRTLATFGRLGKPLGDLWRPLGDLCDPHVLKCPK